MLHNHLAFKLKNGFLLRPSAAVFSSPVRVEGEEGGEEMAHFLFFFHFLIRCCLLVSCLSSAGVHVSLVCVQCIPQHVTTTASCPKGRRGVWDLYLGGERDVFTISRIESLSEVAMNCDIPEIIGNNDQNNNRIILAMEVENSFNSFRMTYKHYYCILLDVPNCQMR